MLLHDTLIGLIALCPQSFAVYLAILYAGHAPVLLKSSLYRFRARFRLSLAKIAGHRKYMNPEYSQSCRSA